MEKTCFFAYVEIGQGLPLHTLGAMLAMLAAVLGALGFYVRYSWDRFKKNRRLIFFTALILALAGLAALWLYLSPGGAVSSENKTIVIGMDGLSADIVERMMSEGKLPNFSRLAKEGTYSRLATVNPPQSPVAWSSFATGLPPSGHGIFDFVKRDPKTYKLKLATADESYKRNPRQGKPFWTTLSENGVPVKIFFCPVTFPPDRVNGVMVSGMGVPDLRGTQGTYFFYTTGSYEKSPTEAACIFQVKAEGGIIKSEIPGLLTRDGTEITVPFEVAVSPKNEKATVTVQEQTFDLQEGQWSDWIKLSFRQGLFRRVAGITKFYLKGLSPEFSLYVSPAEFDPENPAFAISHPKNYSRELAAEIGPFHTRGMPYDTKALEADILDESAFLAHAKSILAEKEAILGRELARFESGLLFFYFAYPDPIQHMFQRSKDNVIADCYKEMDRILGDVLARAPSDATVMVLSDHGFASFEKAVHLNTWLAKEGFLSLKRGSETGGELFADVDWTAARAYACGFNSMYLNKKNREGRGIVTAEAAESVAHAIKTKLEKLTDPETGERVVEEVHVVEGAPGGPDLIIGYRPPYRCSWQTALGAAPKGLVEMNRKKWSGDHCVDAACVPGIFFANKELKRAPASITDVARAVSQLVKPTQ